MSHLDLNGLQRYAQKEKAWADGRFASTFDMNWQKTATAGAVAFTPVPEMPLDPVVNFAFTETGPASGTKAPDNPSTITGVTQAKVTRCGKNIIAFPYAEASSFTRAGITYTTASDGSITANGTATDRSVFYILGQSRKKRYRAGDVITSSGSPANAPAGCRLLFERNRLDGSYIGNYAITSSNQSYTFVAQDDGFFGLSIVINSGVTVSNVVFHPQIEYGSTATSFEPYEGADYAVNLGGTFYGGSVDLSTGVMTVTWEGMVLTGEETITEESQSSSTGAYQYGIKPGLRYAEQGYDVCTHFLRGTGSAGAGRFYVRYTGGTGVRFFTDISTVQGFADFLAAQYANGTPVVFVYKLATPQTVQLTPTQIYSLSQPDPYTPRLNTVYSDQQSVQVGYPKSPLATATELTNAIISLGGNV